MHSNSLIYCGRQAYKITYIYWPIACTPKPSFGGCLKVQKLLTFIGQLITLQKFNLSKWFNLQKLLTSID